MPDFNMPEASVSPRSDLLDELVKRTHCEFISNLPQQRPEVLLAVHSLAAEDFTLRAWKEAILYLSTENPPLNPSIQEARAALLQALEQDILPV